MDPVSLDGRPIIIFDGPIIAEETKIIAAGFGSFNGSDFVIEQDQAKPFVVPEDFFNLVAMPLTGFWKKKYPGYEWYFVAPSRQS